MTKVNQDIDKHKKSQVEVEDLNHYAVRGRIELMKAQHPCLKNWNKYLAKALNRSRSAISHAINGRRNELLQRIVTHLDYLESKRNKAA